ncbi:MAG: L,D-transpeptidase [Solirubrobacteraceae bacterium]
MSESASSPPEPSRRLRAALAVVAAAIPLVPIMVAVGLGGGRGATAQTANSATVFNPVAVPKISAPSLLVPPGPGTLVALVQRGTQMRSRPGGPTYAKLSVHTEFGSPEAMWVVRLSGRWLGVISPKAGNGRVGWIPAAAASLSRVNWKLEVSLSARRLTVLRAGRAVAHFTVAIGAPSAPTPTGRFAVTDRLRTGDPAGPYGCCILALSAQAPHAIQGWSGGNRIAIHSTPETSSIGLAISHGCLRLTLAQGRWLLSHIPLGTPTLISG